MESPNDKEGSEISGSGDLIENQSSNSGFANGGAAAPHYVTEFTNMDYQLQGHMNNGSEPYLYSTEATPEAYPYYQYSANGQHSPSSYNLNTGNQSPTSADDESNQCGAAHKASPVTIQWLLENYESYGEEASLPRCTIYTHYQKHCDEFKLDPMNAASFGKVMRKVFLKKDPKTGKMITAITTKRLGTRGNSKYHYCGLRIKQESPLSRERIIDYSESNFTGTPGTQRLPSLRRGNSGTPTRSVNSRNSSSSPPPPAYMPVNMPIGKPLVSEIDRMSIGDGVIPSIDVHGCLNSLGDDLRKIGLSMNQAIRFVENYKNMCSNVLYLVKLAAFDNIEEVWRKFWQAEREDEDITQMTLEDEYDNGMNQKSLSQHEIFSLSTLPQIQNFVVQMDISFYQVIVDILVPNVLTSQLTPNLTQACRNFAKTAEGHLRRAMKGCPEILQKKKIQAIKYMSQGLRRYTSLNHLAQAARSVLNKQEQITAMYGDYLRVDITQVQEQAGYICGCDSTTVHQIHDAFKDYLKNITPMHMWADWFESIVDQNVQILSNYHHGQPVEKVEAAGKAFLLNWSFYTSMIIRDLTLRSASSFGSFHLIRLLADEYMVYLIESKLAKVQGRPMITVVQGPSDQPLFDGLNHSVLVPQITALPSIGSLKSSNNYSNMGMHNTNEYKYISISSHSELSPTEIIDDEIFSDLDIPMGTL